MDNLKLSLPNWVRLLKTSLQGNDPAVFFLPVVPSTTTTLYPLPRGEKSISIHLDVSETTCVFSSFGIFTALAFDVNVH